MTPNVPVKKRLAESRVGGGIAMLLCLLWLVSMSVVDGHASSFYPVGCGLVAVAVLTFVAIAAGYKVVRISATGWFGIAVGIYFLTRCWLSHSSVAVWYEGGLLLGGFAFYLFGIYAAQRSGGRLLSAALCAAVLLNVAALYLMRETDMSIRVLGRPEMSVCGANSRNSTLFVYKNFAGLVLSLSGVLLLWYAVWRGKWGWKTLLLITMGVAGTVASFFCFSRVPFLVLPVAGGVGAVLWIFLSLYRRKELNFVQMLLGGMIIVGLVLFVIDCIFSHRLIELLFGVDSHLRFAIWAEAWAVVGDAPLWGYGADAAQWFMSVAYDEWQLPNYVHNEFLQGWVDYGIIGAGLMFLFSVVHLVHGVWVLTSEHVSVQRKRVTSLALLCVVCMLAASLTDFIWHNFAIVAMTAFAFGITASPFARPALRLLDFRYWAPDSRSHVRALRAESGVMKLLVLTALVGAGVMVAGLCVKLYPAHKAQWRYDEMVQNGASNEQRRAFLCDVVKIYPDSQIADHYALMGGGNMFWPAYEQMLRLILADNPYQIFSASMLGDVLGRQQKFEEAEAVFRRYYPADGPDNTLLCRWTVYYTTNLYAWAQQCITAGYLEKALSMMQCADIITKSGQQPNTHPGQLYRGGTHCWVDGGSKHRRKFIENCRTDRAVLESIGIQPDHSWRAPMEPGGKPALYSRYIRIEN